MIPVYTYYARLSQFTRAPQTHIGNSVLLYRLVCRAIHSSRGRSTKTLRSCLGRLTHGNAANLATLRSLLAPGVISDNLNVKYGLGSDRTNSYFDSQQNTCL
jgi:hypothetical protein